MSSQFPLSLKETMFKKVLIANRSEIAIRVINACRELDVVPVSIYSQVDRASKHVEYAGESYLLEGNPASVYLDIEQIIRLAKKCGASAIHPGYGFLSENARFARACHDADLTFIGPGPQVIEKMGSKVEFRKSMEAAGVPVVPGTTKPVSEVDEVKRLASKWGYPIAIKASAGGGGRGMKLVKSQEEIVAALQSAQREGQSYFGNDEVYMEKYLPQARHIEIQVLADSFGNVIHLGERDCSTQRRHQKLLEESPAANLPQTLRAEALLAAVQAAAAIGYTSAGTFEGLVCQDKYYLLEVNTRVQVEHPVSEMVCGLDIVKEQLLIAAGNRLSLTQGEVNFRGHSIECRINAEDPFRNFLPSPGKITRYVEPRMPWVRVDTACYEGYEVQPFYDSLLAKLIVWGRTRNEAISRMRVALTNFIIEGVATTIPFHSVLLRDERFVAGNIHTNSVEVELLEDFKKSNLLNARINAPASGDDNKELPLVVPVQEPELLEPAGRSVTHNFEVTIKKRTFRVAVREVKNGSESGISSQDKIAVTKSPQSSNKLASQSKALQEARAPMHGLVKEISVNEGATVVIGQSLLIFEAMKMESVINAEIAGRVERISVKAGQTVEEGAHLLTVNADQSSSHSAERPSKKKSK